MVIRGGKAAKARRKYESVLECRKVGTDYGTVRAPQRRRAVGGAKMNNVVCTRRERGLIGSPHSVLVVSREKLNRPGHKLMCDEGHLGNGEELGEVGPRELFNQGCLSAAPALGLLDRVTCTYHMRNEFKHITTNPLPAARGNQQNHGCFSGASRGEIFSFRRIMGCISASGRPGYTYLLGRCLCASYNTPGGKTTHSQRDGTEASTPAWKIQ